MDNACSFRSAEMRRFMDRWGVRPYYRAAFRPGGNGIVERSHRTIKAMAERAGTSPVEAAYWYNMVPRDGQKEESVPQRSVFTYEWQLGGRDATGEVEQVKNVVQVGDEVWVKPGEARCTTQWKTGRVTGITSANNVDVDGMPRHVLDIRPIVRREQKEGEKERENEEADRERIVDEEEREMPVERRRYPLRTRKVPARLEDHDCDH